MPFNSYSLPQDNRLDPEAEQKRKERQILRDAWTNAKKIALEMLPPTADAKEQAQAKRQVFVSNLLQSLGIKGNPNDYKSYQELKSLGLDVPRDNQNKTIPYKVYTIGWYNAHTPYKIALWSVKDCQRPKDTTAKPKTAKKAK